MSLRLKMIGAVLLGLGAAPALADSGNGCSGATLREAPDDRIAVREIDRRNDPAATRPLQKALASSPGDDHADGHLGDTRRQRDGLQETIGFYQKKHLAP